MQVRSIGQLVPRPLAWLWVGRLVLGELGLLEGDPGLGKSLLALDLCARLSAGRTWPDGSAGPEPCSALVLNAEDDNDHTVRSRLEAAGADRDRVFVVDHDEGDLEEPLRFPSGVSQFDDILTRTGAKLVVIDPILAFLDKNVNPKSDASVRRALRPLARLAAKHGCTILLVLHLNKNPRGKALYRGLDSIAFVAACRSTWLVAPDPQAPRRVVLAQQKNNRAAPQSSLAYEVTAGPDEAPTVSWLGPCAWTADQLLASPHRTPRPQYDRACRFLQSFLKDGPRTSRELWTAAQEEGLSDRTIQRAKIEMEIRSVWVSLDKTPVSYWLLPGQELPATVPPEAAPPDLEPWLRPLRERFPPTTPLDDL